MEGLSRKGNRMFINGEMIGTKHDTMLDLIELSEGTIVLPYLDEFNHLAFRFIKRKNNQPFVDRKVECLLYGYLITKTLNMNVVSDNKHSINKFINAKISELKDILRIIDSQQYISNAGLKKIQHNLVQLVIDYSRENEQVFKVSKRTFNRCLNELISSMMYVTNSKLFSEIEEVCIVNDDNIVIQIHEDDEYKYKYRFIVIDNVVTNELYTDMKNGEVCIQTVSDVVSRIENIILRNRKGVK